MPQKSRRWFDPFKPAAMSISTIPMGMLDEPYGIRAVFRFAATRNRATSQDALMPSADFMIVNQQDVDGHESSRQFTCFVADSSRFLLRFRGGAGFGERV